MIREKGEVECEGEVGYKKSPYVGMHVYPFKGKGDLKNLGVILCK